MTNPAPQAGAFRGLYNPLGLSMFQAPKEGAKGIPAVIQWSDYTTVKDANNADCKAVKFDLSQLASSFSQVGSFYVDNLNSSVSVLIWIEDTQTWYQVAPRMSGYVPVTTNGLRFTVQTLGLPLATDITNFIILNVFTPPEQTGLQQTIIAGQPLSVSISGQPVQTTFAGVIQPVSFAGNAQPVSITGQPINVQFGAAQPVSFAGIAQPIITPNPIQVNFNGVVQPVGFAGIAQPIIVTGQPVGIYPERVSPNNYVSNIVLNNTGTTTTNVLAIGSGTVITGWYASLSAVISGSGVIVQLAWLDHGRVMWTTILNLAPSTTVNIQFNPILHTDILRENVGATQFFVNVMSGAFNGASIDAGLFVY